MVSETDWTEVIGLNEPYYNIGELEWCSNYEYQIKTICSAENQTEWNTSSLITTDGCCVPPELESLSLEVLSDTEALISWPNVLAAEGYNLVYSQLGGMAYTIENIQGGSYTLTELETLHRI